MDFAELKGKTLAGIDTIQDGGDMIEIIFRTESESFRLFHDQDCCESVFVESIAGNLDDLIGSPILLAEVSVSENQTPDGIKSPEPELDDSFTWTFYKLATIKGYVDFRWYGSSNGYYSEDVSFERVRVTA